MRPVPVHQLAAYLSHCPFLDSVRQHGNQPDSNENKRIDCKKFHHARIPSTIHRICSPRASAWSSLAYSASRACRLPETSPCFSSRSLPVIGQPSVSWLVFP